jgi:hypothetical protein
MYATVWATKGPKREKEANEAATEHKRTKEHKGGQRGRNTRTERVQKSKRRGWLAALKNARVEIKRSKKRKVEK